MYSLKNVEIEGFWGRGRVSCSFYNDVNIIIGRNGTGKTTLMHILHSVLKCDLNGLVESSFKKVIITLVSGELTKKISVSIIENRHGIEEAIYVIGEKQYRIPLLLSLERRHTLLGRRRSEEEANEVRNELGRLLKITSISVYRLRHDETFEVRDKFGSRITAPVDFRLEIALNELAQYCAELNLQEQEVSRELQKEVLISMLYSAEDEHSRPSISDFNREDEEEELFRAYKQLRAIDENVAKRIKEHAKAVEKSILDIKENKDDIDINPLESYIKTRKVIYLSLEANEKLEKIRKQLNLFIDKLGSFMPEKEFVIESGKLVVKNAFGVIEAKRLSSGEKQLVILLIEALLQKKEDFLFLADEPEISLHIEWQGKIIPVVRELNPNAQVIVATHSPEVAAPYRDKIFNMTEIYSE